MTEGSTTESSSTKRPPPDDLLARLLDGFASLRTKLVLPYVLLTLILAFLGIFIVTRLVTSSVRERFVNQLYEAGRVSADAIVRREREHLSSLRLMAFSAGVPEGLAERDADQLSEVLFPLALNEDIDSVIAVDQDGREILGLVQSGAVGTYERTSGSDLSGYDFVAQVLSGDADEAGDKFVGLVDTSFGTYLYTSAPVENDQGENVGALLVGSQLQTLVGEIKAQALADLALLGADGELLATTLAEPDGGYDTSPLVRTPAAAASGVQLAEYQLYGRPYQAAYSPWIVRGQVLGRMGVVLPSNFVVTTEATSRNLFSLIFALGTLAVILIGYLLSQNIARPILELRSMAQAVAAGDLSQASGLRRSDEIGDLAEAFDTMTARLHSRTEEASRLYEETVQRNQQLAEMYERLQAAQQQLVQSEKLAAVGQLAAGIVHDVKNPLGVIKGMAEELMFEAGENPELKQGLTIIRDNADRANLIVTDLLKFARQSTPTMKQRDLRETINGCLRLTDYLIRKAKVNSHSELPDHPVWATYDAQQIEQVLINLIQNSVQAMAQGGELTLSLCESNGDAIIQVEDTGEGIAQEHLSRIFEPFFTTKPEGKGTGMGLAVSYGIVSRHGGHIDVESERGEGTTFEIRLPKEAEPERQAQEIAT